jgi:hypothetical protein
VVFDSGSTFSWFKVVQAIRQASTNKTTQPELRTVPVTLSIGEVVRAARFVEPWQR